MYGNRLRSLRKARRWTLEEVAHKLDVGRSTYAGYENETRQPPIERIRQLAELYGVSSDYILGLSDDMDPKIVDANIYEYLKKNDLNWKGAPITEEELGPIKELLEIIARDRLPNVKK